MDLFKIVKYVLSVACIAAIVYAVLAKDDSSPAVPISTQPQTKFNF